MLAFQLLLKDHYNLPPTQSGVFVSIMWLPWTLKLFYGILFDTVPLCGSRKKSWMIVMSLIVVTTGFIMSFVRFENPTILLCTITLQNSANAGADVLVDALMVMQAKRDPVNGSQEL